MHDDSKRQLLAPGAAILILLSGAPSSAEDRQTTTIVDSLRAAKVVDMALATRNAGGEDWRKRDQFYADLAAEYPTDTRVKSAFGESLWIRGERDRAIGQWEVAEKLDPKNAVVLNHLANAWLAAGDVRKSAAFAERAVSCEPQNADYHFALANTSFLFRHDLANPERTNSEAVLLSALHHFAEASRLAPGNAEYARAYAETFYSIPKPDWRAALAAWGLYMELVPKKDFALTNLARVHLKLGQKEAAMQCLSKVQGAEYEKLKRRLEAQADRPAESAAP